MYIEESKLPFQVKTRALSEWMAGLSPSQLPSSFLPFFLCMIIRPELKKKRKEIEGEKRKNRDPKESAKKKKRNVCQNFGP